MRNIIFVLYILWRIIIYVNIISYNVGSKKKKKMNEKIVLLFKLFNGFFLKNRQVRKLEIGLQITYKYVLRCMWISISLCICDVCARFPVFVFTNLLLLRRCVSYIGRRATLFGGLLRKSIARNMHNNDNDDNRLNIVILYGQFYSTADRRKIITIIILSYTQYVIRKRFSRVGYFH